MSSIRLQSWFGQRKHRYSASGRRSWLRNSIKANLAVERLESRQLMVADLVNFLTTEHVDLNIAHSSGAWSVGPRNSDEVPAIQYGNDDAILYAGSPSVIGRPGGSSFDFIGTGAGQPVYVLLQILGELLILLFEYLAF